MNNEKTNQTDRITFRLFHEHHQMLKEEARASGMTVSSLIKYRIFNDSAKLMDSKPARTPADVNELRRILGHLGKIGSNVNQIAFKLNQRNYSDFDLRELGRFRTELSIAREAIMKAMNVTWDKNDRKVKSN